MERDTRRLAMVSVAMGICVVTLVPVHPGLVEALRRSGFPIQAYIEAAGTFSLFDAFQNILLFIPLGCLAAADGGDSPARAARRSAWICLGLSAAVECAQGWIPGRFPSLWDLVFNTLGGFAGAALAQAMPPDDSALPADADWRGADFP